LERILRLVSATTGPLCAENVWIDLEPSFSLVGNAFRLPVDAQTQLSFSVTSSLVAPELGGRLCFDPPCGDTVSLTLEERQGAKIAYVFARAPTAQPNDEIPFYGEIFMDPTQGVPPRNLLQDFSTIPEFDGLDPCGVSIESIEFEVESRGSATLSDLCIGTSCSSIRVPEPSAPTAALAGLIGVVLLARRR
jgi:uncharacterized protein (TIGR03382 family)